jgi:phosphoribosylamine---glycine ligase
LNILIIGAGGREHALAWKIKQSPLVTELFIAPGNGGTALLGTNVQIKDDDIESIVAFALRQRIDLVVAGPELPLTLGLTDALMRHGIRCFGPSSLGARLEGSKAFAKKLMRDAGVPTADFQVFEDYHAALAYVRAAPFPLVIKADGLAAGKGVVMAESLAQAEDALSAMMIDCCFGQAGKTVVIEETLRGEEASFMVFCDGTNIVPMPSLQDHKRIGDNDTGLNTGGMGAYSPAPVLPHSKSEELVQLCIVPIIEKLARQGQPYKGVLYAGLMMTETGPMVLEYNVRFGDPECQPLMKRLKSDLISIMLACVEGNLSSDIVSFSDDCSCCVVMAASGYPQNYPTGMTVLGISDAEQINSVTVFQAGTVLDGQTVKTTGGRVLGITALGATLEQARERAYLAVRKITFPNNYYRTDIAVKGLRR